MNEEKTKKAPGTADDYDLEMAVMRRCKKLVRSLPNDKRMAVVRWLASAVMDGAVAPPLPAPPPDPRQADLF